MGNLTPPLYGDFLKAFEKVPDLYLILSPELLILTASDAYLRATGTVRDEIAGKKLFDVFPDNPMATEANAVKNLQRSLQQALSSKQPHRMALQHYDIPDATQPGGFAVKYWLPLNTPVLDEQGQVHYIIHKVEDATEKVLAEKEKAREFRHLNDAQTIGHIGSFERYLTESVISCSNEWYRLHGLEPQSELITVERMYSFFHPEDRQQTLEAIQHTLTTGEPMQMVGRIVRADGAVRYLQRKAEVLQDEQGKPYKVYGTVQDITEYVEARKKVEERETLLRATEEVANLGSYELDVATQTIRFSDGLYRLFGEAPQSFAPSLPFIDERSHPDDVPVVKTVLEKAILQKNPYHYTRRIYHADGTLRTLEAQGRVECDASGQAVKLIGLVQDATERIKAEQELKQSRELLKTTIDSSLDMIQVFEAVRDENGDIIDFKWILNNHTSEAIYGDVLGKNLLENNPGVVAEGIFDTFKQVVETGIPDQSERHYVYEQFDGWFHQSTVKLHDGVATTTSDITERKKAEQALQQSKNLLQGILDAPNVGMAVYKAVRDDKGAIVNFVHEFINKRTLEILGGFDMTGRLLSDHGEAGTKQIAEFSEVLATGRQSSYVIQRELLGTNHWILISNARLDPERLVHVWDDITEQKEKDLELLRLKDEVAQRVTDKYYTIFSSIDEGFCIQELIYDANEKLIDLQIVEANPAYERQTGFSKADIVGKLHSELGLATESYWFEVYDRTAKTGKAETFENWHEATGRWYHASLSRIGGEGSRQLAVVFNDITERKHQEIRQQFLLKLTDTIRPLVDPTEIMARVSELVGRHFNVGRCGYAEVPLTSDHLVIARDWNNGRMQSLQGSHPLSGFGDEIIHQYRTGETIVVEDTFAGARNEEEGIKAAGDVRSGIAVQLMKGRNWVASFYVQDTKRRTWTQDEVGLMEEIAERTWAALERAKVEKLLEKELQDTRKLQQISNRIIEQGSTESLYEAILESAAELMHSDAASMQMLIPETNELWLLASKGFHAESESIWQQVQVNSGSTCSVALSENNRIIVPDIEACDFMIGTIDQEAYRLSGIRAVQSTPLISRFGNKVGMISTHWKQVYQPTEQELGLLDVLARQAADLIEKMRGEEALRESEQRFQSIANLVPDLLWDSEPDGSTNWYNQRWLEYTGQRLDQAIGWGWTDAIHPDDREGSAKRYGEAIEAGKPLRQEYRIRRHDGEYRWFVVSASPLKDESGHLVKMYGAATDIHDLKQIEEALRKGEKQLRLITDSMPALISYVDDGFRYRFANRQYENWFGYKPEEIIGKQVQEFLGDAAFDRIRPYGLAALAGKRQSFEEEIPFKDGGTRYVHSDFVPEVRPDGSVAGYYSLVLDITASKLAEEALRASEEKYRSLFDSIDEGYCIIQMLYDDTGKATDFRYLQVNQAFARNTDLTDAEGKTIRELAPDIEPKWMEIYDQVARTGIPLRFEEASEALHHIFSLYAFRIGEPAEHKVAVIFSDVTERRKSQEALRQSEEQFRLFVMASSDIIYKMGADWSYMHKLTGKNFLPDTNEPTNSWLELYIPAADRPMVIEAIQKAIRTNSIFRLEHRVNKTDGTVGWVSSRAIPVIDKAGAIKEWFGTASDITLRKQAEQKLNELNESLEQQVAERTHELSESKLLAEQIMEATPDFIMIFSLQTNSVEFVNQSPYTGNDDLNHRTLHINFDLLLSRSHPDDRKKLHSFINGFRSITDQEVYTLEYRLVNQGKLTWYRTRGKVFRRDAAGKPTHFISVVQDISDLKQLEQENLKMRLDQQRTNLLAILEAQEEERRRISEGLHNGVGQILYAAKIHLNNYRSQVETDKKQPTLSQVDQILEQAIIETRALSHKLAPAVLEHFGLKTAFEEVCNSLSSRSLVISCRVGNLPKKIEKHLQTLVYRIAQELATNIVKHARATKASLSLSWQQDTLVLLAEDDGQGFDPEQVSAKGIGLSSIKDRVKLLNGTIRIESQPGNGTLIEINFPLPARMHARQLA